jgi:hypothetical protein
MTKLNSKKQNKNMRLRVKQSFDTDWLLNLLSIDLNKRKLWLFGIIWPFWNQYYYDQRYYYNFKIFSHIFIYPTKAIEHFFQELKLVGE